MELIRLTVRRVAIAIILAFVMRESAFGQGGPPMITDDLGTPGNAKWENNLAIAFEHRFGETAYDVPAIDLNYGVGGHIQLTLQTASVLPHRFRFATTDREIQRLFRHSDRPCLCEQSRSPQAAQERL